MRMRRKPNLIPRMERCSRVLISDPEARRGNWRELMPEAETVYLELGCGKGRFTAETAEQNPKALYIAVERVPDAMVIAMERVCARALHNVFFVDVLSGRIRLDNVLNVVKKQDKLYISYLWKGEDPVIAQIAVKPKYFDKIKNAITSANPKVRYYDETEDSSGDQ